MTDYKAMGVLEKTRFFQENHIVDVMKAFREREDLNQEELGKLLGKSLATIHLYETRKRSVPKSVAFMMGSFWVTSSDVNFKDRVNQPAGDAS